MAGGRTMSRSCEIGDEIDLDDYAEAISSVVLLQAQVRGYLTRKWLTRDVRGEFEAIVQDTEPDAQLNIAWGSQNICLPTVEKKRSRKYYHHNADEKLQTSHKMCYENHQCCGVTNVSGDEANVKMPHEGNCTDDPEKETQTCNTGKCLSNPGCGHVSREITMTAPPVERTDRPSVVVPQADDRLSVAVPQADDRLSGAVPPTDDRLSGAVPPTDDRLSGAVPPTDDRLSGAVPPTDDRLFGAVPPADNRLSETVPPHKDETDGVELEVCEHLDHSRDDVNNTGQSVPYPQDDDDDDTQHVAHTTPFGSSTNVSFANNSTRHWGDSTSFWEGDESLSEDTPTKTKVSSSSHPKSFLGTNPDALRERRHHIAMELLWVQQAIQSRKNYLRLKQQMDTTKG